jgi:hypothetical protein
MSLCPGQTTIWSHGWILAFFPGIFWHFPLRNLHITVNVWEFFAISSFHMSSELTPSFPSNSHCLANSQVILLTLFRDGYLDEGTPHNITVSFSCIECVSTFWISIFVIEILTSIYFCEILYTNSCNIYFRFVSKFFIETTKTIW